MKLYAVVWRDSKTDKIRGRISESEILAKQFCDIVIECLDPKNEPVIVEIPLKGLVL